MAGPVSSPEESSLSFGITARRITKACETSNPVIRSFIASFDVASYTEGPTALTALAAPPFCTDDVSPKIPMQTLTISIKQDGEPFSRKSEVSAHRPLLV